MPGLGRISPSLHVLADSCNVYVLVADDAGARGSLRLTARAPERPDERRRLITAEILIDGETQGPVCGPSCASSTEA